MKSLVLVAALLAPMPVYAECAWVLWNEFTLAGKGPTASHTILVSASSTHQQCEQDRLAKMRDLLRITDVDKSGPNVVRVTSEEMGSNVAVKKTLLKDGATLLEISLLRCLPDTIDPRGPKSK